MMSTREQRDEAVRIAGELLRQAVEKLVSDYQHGKEKETVGGRR